VLLRPQNEISRYICVTILLEAYMIQNTFTLFTNSASDNIEISAFVGIIALLYTYHTFLSHLVESEIGLNKSLKNNLFLGSFYQIHILHTIGCFYEILCTRTLRIVSH